MSSEALISEHPPAPVVTGAWPGARHSRWTLVRTLSGPARDLLAATTEPARALVAGPEGEDVATELLRLGYASVTATSGTGDDALETHAGQTFALVLLLSPDALGTDEEQALAWAHERTSGACAICTTDRHATRERARAAGFGRITLLEPTADAERSWVMHERLLLLARPAVDEPAADGAEEDADAG